MRTITNVFMSFRSFVNSFRHTGMSRIPVPIVHPYSKGGEKTKTPLSIGIAPLEDEGSNILRVTTSVAGKPASQSHPLKYLLYSQMNRSPFNGEVSVRNY